MYGITPRAKIEALSNAPPEKRLIMSKKNQFLLVLTCAWESTPGMGTKTPNLYIISINKV